MPICWELLFSDTSGTMGPASLPGGSKIPGMGSAGKSTNTPSSGKVNIWDPYHGWAVLIEDKQSLKLGVVLWEGGGVWRLGKMPVG